MQEENSWQHITSTYINQCIIENSQLFTILIRSLKKPSNAQRVFPFPVFLERHLKNINTTKKIIT